ncbi:winged helix-turn-helix domain-containing protein [Halocatena halophila]|uniref:winged helix-turn-helix domain-containing protein n=1 Tax=Halocatena halophila TaxID=2814576 RepID=UPI002ED1F10A
MTGSSLVVSESTPAEVFGKLSHPVRIEILQALATTETPCSFGELRSASSIDDPGQFNYHIRTLDGAFVSNTDDGYELSVAGHRLVGAVRSGVATERFECTQLSLDGSCQSCGGNIIASLDDRTIEIACDDCTAVHTEASLPPGSLEGDSPDSVATTIDRWCKRMQADAEHGICPNCSAELNRRVVIPADEDAPNWLTGDDLEATVLYNCEHCGERFQSVLQYALLTHPAVISAYYEAGIDLRNRLNWEIPGIDSTSAEVAATDPLAVVVPFTINDTRHRFVVNRSLELLETRTD